MTKQDWFTAGAVAVGVAVITALMTRLPACRADGPAVAAIPPLPPAQLQIPAMNAVVSATTTPVPGQAVTVNLTLKSPSRLAVTQVPVTVTVINRSFNPLSRGGGQESSKQVAQATTSVWVGLDGNGQAVVKLPLLWQAPLPAAGTPAQVAAGNVNSYQIVLSATLGYQPATTDPQIIPAAPNPRAVTSAPAPATRTSAAAQPQRSTSRLLLTRAPGLHITKLNQGVRQTGGLHIRKLHYEG